jgi:hypothetical protein
MQENNNYFYRIPNKNIHTLFAFTDQQKNHSTANLYVNIATGHLKMLDESIPDKWNKASISWTGNVLHLQLEDGSEQTLSLIARKVMKGTLTMFQTFCHFDIHDGLDRLTLDLNQIHIRSATGISLFKQAEACLGVNATLLSQIEDVELLAKHLFTLVRLRLEDPEALTPDGIKSIHALLYHSLIEKFSRESAAETNHPCWVLDRLNEAVSALESNLPELAPTSTLERKMKMQSDTYENAFAGANASYFLKGLKGQKLWVMKPGAEEKPDVLTNLNPGDGAKREHVATILNHSGKYPIPYTAYAVINGKVCSLQAFVNGSNLIAVQTLPNGSDILAKLPILDAQATMHFDIRCNNTDRHTGNVLVEKEPLSTDEDFIPIHLHAIDQGGCMPVSAKDPSKFEHLYLPQMLEPMHSELLTLSIETDESADAEIMRLHGIGEEAIHRMKNGALLLRIAAKKTLENRTENAAEITFYDLGLITMKNPDLLWKEDPEKDFTSLCADIISLKTQIKAICQTQRNPNKLQRMSMQKLKTEYAKTNNDPLNVMCLFGISPTESPQRGEVGISDSILWKFAESLLKS